MTRSLAPGDRGDAVKQMQRALIDKGYFCGEAGIDGIFGEDTLRALETFQDNEALTVQPLCDQATWTALGLPGAKTA
jgi:peptidoglycan hydrolase-like protein with peptidoglycan-binding domain